MERIKYDKNPLRQSRQKKKGRNLSYKSDTGTDFTPRILVFRSLYYSTIPTKLHNYIIFATIDVTEPLQLITYSMEQSPSWEATWFSS